MLVVWGRRNSTNVIKVLWLAELLGVAIDRRDVGGPFGGLDNPDFLVLNPHGGIPVLQDGPTTVWESHAILRYLADREGAEALYPADRSARARVESWLDWHLGSLAPVLNPVFIALYRTPAAERDEAETAAKIARLTGTVTRLDRQLADRPYVAGETFTIADVAFANSIWRWSSFTFARPALPRLAAWQERISTQQGYREIVAQPLT